MKTIVKAPVSPEPTRIETDNRILAREAAIEGIVLLQNDGVLPLKDRSIALYGAGARMTVKGGRGSGEVRNRHSVSIAQGLEKEGFEILTGNWLDGFDRYFSETYEAYRQDSERKVEGLRDFSRILRTVPPFIYPTGMGIGREDLAECDTAIYVLSRQAGEGSDRRNEKSDFLLSDVEEQNIRCLRENYKNLVLVINVGGLIDLSILDGVQVNALVYIVQGGEEGGSAFAKLVSGERNFSGKLTTSWPYKLSDVPSSRNYSYAGSDPYSQDYDEGIYVGYRYYDRFKIKPRFPFGFGLSYTSFFCAYSDISFEKGKFSVSVSVENTGKKEGKESVLLYSTLPAQDSEVKRLVAFAKTDNLNPGEEQLLRLDVQIRDLAVYDESAAAWIVKSGRYGLLLGDCPDYVLCLTVKQDYILEQCTNICPLPVELNELKAQDKSIVIPSGIPSYELDTWIPETVVHNYEKLREDIDPLIKSMNDRQLCTLVIGGTTSPKYTQVCALGASGTTTPELYEQLGIPNAVLSDGPAGLNLTRYVVLLPDGRVKAAKVPENLEDYKRYLFGFAKIALGSQMAKPEDGTMHYQFATAWPASQLLAQSFNTELMQNIGDAVGKEMEAYGVTIWLAPGMNIHRNPLCGRTFEYYSEDPLVSGKMAASIVRGVQSHKGKGMSVKHFVANNCELNRNNSSSNMREKTLREIYLRGFEIAVKESRPGTVMASYNLVNGLHVVNNYDLLNKVLRNEWGFKGMVMSDWDSMKADPGEPCIPLSGDVQKAHAAGCDLVCPGRPDQIEALLAGLAGGVVKRADLECAAQRVLRLVRSNSELESR